MKNAMKTSSELFSKTRIRLDTAQGGHNYAFKWLNLAVFGPGMLCQAK